MVRFMVREVVRDGHYTAYKAACKAWNDAAIKLGLPAFRYYSSAWGAANEVFLEAEYKDSSDIERRFAAAHAANDPAFDAAELAIASHRVEAQSYSYVLTSMPLE